MRPLKVVSLNGGCSKVIADALRWADVLFGVKTEQTYGVPVTDDGRGTGQLRKDFPHCTGCLGDFMGTAINLSPRKDLAYMDYRFPSGKYEGQSARNLMFFAKIQTYGIEAAVSSIWKDLRLEPYRVFPVSKDGAVLCAKVLDEGSGLTEEHEGETEIADFLNSWRYDPDHHIVTDLFLKKNVAAWPELCEAIRVADYIILGPGSFFTSTLAALLPIGIREAIRNSHAQVIFIPNLMQVEWKSRAFGLEKYLAWIEQESFLGRPIDIILFSHQDPEMPGQARENYERQGKHRVQPRDTFTMMEEKRFLMQPLLTVTPEGAIVHDPTLLAAAFSRAFQEFPPKEY